MKLILKLTITVFLLNNSILIAQGKLERIYFNKLTEIKGTPYVIASVENVTKLFSVKSRYLLFINTLTGEKQQIDFSKDGYIGKIEQIKIDSLKLNKLIVKANVFDLNKDNKIDGKDPESLIVFSVDGKEQIKITDDNFFVSYWTVNNLTGNIVITGFYDTNNNSERDNSDKNTILLYDLKASKIISKINN